MKVLVTGASGFLGHWVVRSLLTQGDEVWAASGRSAGSLVASSNLHWLPSWDLETLSTCPWPSVPADATIHLAAKVHSPKASQEEFEKVNVAGTLSLLKYTIKTGATHFVFLSTIGVHGAAHPERQDMVTEESPLRPENAYSMSKLKAEELVEGECSRHGLRCTIVRPPLVYGPGAPGNIQTLEKWLSQRRPIPLGKIQNRRSFIHIGNLTHFLRACLIREGSSCRTFVVADEEPISTEALVNFLADQKGVTPKIVKLPTALLAACGTLVGKRHQVEQLTGNLTISNARAKRELSWVPPHETLGSYSDLEVHHGH